MWTDVPFSFSIKCFFFLSPYFSSSWWYITECISWNMKYLAGRCPQWGPSVSVHTISRLTESQKCGTFQTVALKTMVLFLLCTVEQSCSYHSQQSGMRNMRSVSCCVQTRCHSGQIVMIIFIIDEYANFVWRKNEIEMYSFINSLFWGFNISYFRYFLIKK